MRATMGTHNSLPDASRDTPDARHAENLQPQVYPHEASSHHAWYIRKRPVILEVIHTGFHSAHSGPRTVIHALSTPCPRETASNSQGGNRPDCEPVPQPIASRVRPQGQTRGSE